MSRASTAIAVATATILFFAALPVPAEITAVTFKTSRNVSFY